MSQAPIFSIIIPTHNRLKSLIEALESVFQQTVEDYEVIVVDDGSTDGTADAITRFAAENGWRMAERRVAPEDRRSEIGDREPENYEPRMTRMGTDEEATAGRRPGSRAGASESDSLTSKLADSPVSESLTRSASIPASIPATSYSLPATAPEALVGGAGELVAAMCRVAARDGVSRYHKWSGLPFLWDEEWI